MSETVWLTREAFDALATELDNLKTVARPAISAKIAAARSEGDLSENGGYHAAREEQGLIEGRISQLEAMLRDAQVGAATNTDQASVGSKVTVKYDADDTETFLIGSREMLGVSDIELPVYSPQSRLGEAVLGHHAGDKVEYTAPNGRTIHVDVISVEVFQA